jgi:hypothetical protein
MMYIVTEYAYCVSMLYGEMHFNTLLLCAALSSAVQ